MPPRDTKVSQCFRTNVQHCVCASQNPWQRKAGHCQGNSLVSQLLGEAALLLLLAVCALKLRRMCKKTAMRRLMIWSE